MNTGRASGLVGRFQARLRGLLPETGRPVIAAVSGGRDSVALLHLLRFRSGLDPGAIVVAHFDHRMRAGSAADAGWVRGLCQAWGLACRTGTAATPLRSEAEARRARYDFLLSVRVHEGASLVLTAHHADDQAETVLFRAVRGAGPRGLSGMRELTHRGVARPLLSIGGGELADYARSARLVYRTDPSNLDIGMARNRLRLDVLPRLESVAPGARDALVRLGSVMEGVDGALAALAESFLRAALREERAGVLVLDRNRLNELPQPARAQVLRSAAQRLGVMLDQAGTRLALEVTSQGASGKRVDLGRGLQLVREFDQLRFALPAPATVDVVAQIAGPGVGQAELSLGGREWTARWSDEGPAGTPIMESFSLDRLSFPLTVRGWLPGDRMRLSYGTKKLKKLFQEARLPTSDRRRRPIVVDGRGRVLWAPAVAGALGEVVAGPGPFLHVGFDDAVVRT